MAAFKKLAEEVHAMAYEKIENNPKDFRYDEEPEEDIHRKIKYLNQHLQDAIENEQKKEELAAIGALGLAYHKLSAYDKAEEYYTRQLELASKQDDVCAQRQANCNLGVIAKIKCDLSKALVHFKEAMTISEQRNEQQSIARIYNNLANISEMQMDLDKAIIYHQKRFDIAKEIEDKDGASKAAASLGGLYHCLGNYKESIKYYEELLVYSRLKLKIQDNLADDASGSSDDDYVDFETNEQDEDDPEGDGSKSKGGKQGGKGKFKRPFKKSGGQKKGKK